MKKAERWTERRTPETKVVESPDKAMENGRHPPEAEVVESPDKAAETDGTLDAKVVESHDEAARAEGTAGSGSCGVSRRSGERGRHCPEADVVKSFGTICESGNGNEDLFGGTHGR